MGLIHLIDLSIMALPPPPPRSRRPPFCMYNSPIDPAELEHEGFYSPTYYQFIFQRKQYYMNNGTIFDKTYNIFNPPVYFKQWNKLNQFYEYISNPANLHPVIVQVEQSMAIFRDTFDFNCNSLNDTSLVKMFCNPAVFESKLRFKLFFAFGLLYHFLDQSKFKLLIRGGMALRMNLKDNMRRSNLIEMESASSADMDGLVIVDPSVSPDSLNAFKTVFMKLLVMAIANLIDSTDALDCYIASGDPTKSTIKILIKRTGTYTELADISFKYSNDNELIEKYMQNLSSYDSPNSSNILFPYIWFYPNMNALIWEYNHVVDHLTRLNDQESKQDSQEQDRSSRITDLEKFKIKRTIARGYGGKKRTVRRRKKTL